MNRRDLLKLGLMAAAGLALRPHVARATGDKKVLPPACPPSDVAARLAKLHARPRHSRPLRQPLIKTLKSAADIRHAFAKGVVAYLADSEQEVRKQAENAPRSKLYVRLLVNNKNATYPFSGKFGTTPQNARKLLRLGKTLGLEPYGTHFHVGGQCFSARAWESPAREAAAIFRDLQKEGIHLTSFDIGGGYPAPYLGRSIPTLREILAVVDRVLKQELPDLPLTVAVEPGRAIAASAAALSCRLILRASLSDGEALPLDAGTYEGLND